MAALPRRASEQETVVLIQDHVQVTADTTVKFFKTSGRRFRIDKVTYVNVTGLVADVANFFALSVRAGATVMASWSTETGEEGTIAADTFVTLTNGTLANRVVAPDTVLSIVLDETGTATLPAGKFVIHGRYL